MLTYEGHTVATRTATARNSTNGNPYARARINTGTREKPVYRDALFFANTFAQHGETPADTHARAMAEAEAFHAELQRYRSTKIRFRATLHVKEFTLGRGTSSERRVLEEEYWANIRDVEAYSYTKKDFVKGVANANSDRDAFFAALPDRANLATADAAAQRVAARPTPDVLVPFDPNEPDVEAAMGALFPA